MPDAELMPSMTFALGERTEKQRLMNALINDYEEAKRLKNLKKLSPLRKVIKEALREFVKSAGGGHPRPQWIIPVMKANVAGAFGKLKSAIRWETLGLKGADTNLQKAASEHNLSDHYRRAGRLLQALDYAQKAYRHAPDVPVFAIGLAQALYRAGLREEADRVFSAVGSISNLSDPEDQLAAGLRYECELREMDLPSVRALFTKLGD